MALVGLLGLLARGLLIGTGAFALVALAPAAAAAVPWVGVSPGTPAPGPLHGAAARCASHRHRRRGEPLAAGGAGRRRRVDDRRGPQLVADVRRRADDRRSAVGSARTPRRGARSPRASTATTTGRRSWRAWDRSDTTCRSCRDRRLAISDFLHEGNGDIWLERHRPGAAVCGVGAGRGDTREGGDILAETARENPRLLDGFSRVCEGGGVALYRRELTLSRRCERRRCVRDCPRAYPAQREPVHVEAIKRRMVRIAAPRR